MVYGYKTVVWSIVFCTTAVVNKQTVADQVSGPYTLADQVSGRTFADQISGGSAVASRPAHPARTLAATAVRYTRSCGSVYL